MNKEWKATEIHNERTIASFIFILLLMLLFGAYVFQSLEPSARLTVLKGSLFVSDAGQSHGGFEYAAAWNATLQVQGTYGALRLVLSSGLGDAITQHEYSITDFSKTANQDFHESFW